MKELVHPVVPFDVYRKVRAKIIGYPVLISVRIVNPFGAPVFVLGNGQRYGPAGAVGYIQ